MYLVSGLDIRLFYTPLQVANVAVKYVTKLECCVTNVTDPMSKSCCYRRLINHGSSYCVASKSKVKNGQTA
jgi:hypothetical protein